ncbi:MAG: FkbM family methyltransferase [Pseudomonadales bacterium]|jgi:FkbM family methyltransferase|nr:FkbM family methyltransferase [Pseudomonadales bacterium]
MQASPRKLRTLIKNYFFYGPFRLYYACYNEWKWHICEAAYFFYIKNSHRVNAIADILEDKKSKKIYLGLIQFRKERNVRNYPFHLVEEEQYFIKEFSFDKNEVFIDCGAYTGDTIDNFFRHCKRYKQIVALEPDLKKFKELKNKYCKKSKIKPLNIGAYDKNGVIKFAEIDNGGSRIIENDRNNSAYSIKTKTIDSLNIKDVTFIKMDIEGAELKALKGAKKTILKNKPKLAIAIYHSNEDMVDIVEYVHSLVPEYKLYVRQYGLVHETVLYAIMPS